MEALLAFVGGLLLGMVIANVASYSRGWTAGKKAALNSVYGKYPVSRYPSEFRPATRTGARDDDV